MKSVVSQHSQRKSFIPRLTSIALGVISAIGLLTLASEVHAQTTSYAVGGLMLTPTTPVTVGSITTRITSNAEVLVQDSAGGILWRTNNVGSCASNGCNLRFQGDGNLVINYAPSGALALSNTQNKFSAQLTLSATPPYIAVTNAGSTLWSTGSTVPTSVGYLPGGLSLSAGQSVNVGGVSLQLTSAGDVQVRNVSTTALLWSAGTSASCGAPSACALSFDVTGALKLTGPSGLVWTSSTATTAVGGSLVISKYAPYLSIVEGKNVLWGAGSGTTGITFGPGFTIPVGTKTSVGSVNLELTTTGNVKVSNSGGTLWQSNTTVSGCSVGSSCRLIFQPDGNLVLRNASNVGVWSTNTFNNNLSALSFSGSAPYLSIYNIAHEKIWDSTSGSVTPSARTVSTPIRGTGTQAASLRAFLDSLGVNTHISVYEPNENLVLQKLQYIGVKTIREAVPTTTVLQSKLQTLATNGIRFNLSGYNTNAASVVAAAKVVDNMAPGALDSLEGVNEINNFSFSYDGFTCRAGWPNNCAGAVAAAQLGLYTASHGDSQLAAIPVYDFTAGNSALHAAALGLRTLNSRADFGNVHVYPGDAQPHSWLASIMGSEYSGLTASQGVVTESGYTVATVSQRSQAIMGINMWLDGFRLGYRRTFLYELTDGNGEQYGFYDGSHNPRQLATVAHNLTTILADTGSVTMPGTLSWSANGFTGNSLLLQKSNGAFYLILWNEPKVANGLTDVAITPSPVQVTFQNVKSVATFDPFIQPHALYATIHPTVQPSITSTVNIGANAVILGVTP